MVKLSFITDQEEMDVIIALHVSNTAKVQDVKNGLKPLLYDIITTSNIDSGSVKYSLVLFGPKSEVIFDFTKHKKMKKTLKEFRRLKLKQMRRKGSNIVNLMNTIQTELLDPSKSINRKDVPNLLILITDRASSSNINDVVRESSALKNMDTSIFTIGVKNADVNELETLASDPTDQFSFIGSAYSDLSSSQVLRDKLSQKFKICKFIFCCQNMLR